MADQPSGQRAFKNKQGIDKSKAAKLFIDNYYANLLKQRSERDERRKELSKELEGLDKKQRKEKEKEIEKSEQAYTRKLREKITRTDFKSIKLVGRGAFGEVRLVQHKETGQYYAMKVINKDFMLEKNQLAHARAERDAMVEHDDPGIVTLYFSFQDENFLYFVMEFLNGGDMMNLLITKDILSEDETRFYIAELILAVHAVHMKHYIHRDLKPDNILIDKDGHIKLSDFGLCTSYHESHLSSFYQTTVPKGLDHTASRPKRPPTTNEAMVRRRSSWRKMRKAMSYSTVGTSNYMAPEILLEQGYGKEVDWWSIGVIMYECLFGYAPFSCEDTTETCLMILDWRNSLEFPKEAGLSPEAIDLMSRLICDSENRLGFEKIVKHPWFKNLDWKTVRDQTPPWKPDIVDPTDCKYFDVLDVDEGGDWFDSEVDTVDPTTASPLFKHLNQKHLPFVGWTFKRYTNKPKPAVSTVFGMQDDESSEQSESDSSSAAVAASDDSSKKLKEEKKRSNSTVSKKDKL